MPNAKVLESKKTVVDALSEKIQNATSAVFVDYKGITVAQDTELRNQFRAAGVEYAVVKNTLTRFAANKAGYTEFDELLNGTTSMASTTDDPIAPARVVCEFAKKNKNVVKIKGGMVEGKVLSVEELMSFGELPSSVSQNSTASRIINTAAPVYFPVRSRSIRILRCVLPLSPDCTTFPASCRAWRTQSAGAECSGRCGVSVM